MIVILPAEKGRVTVVVDKTDYFDEMDALVNDEQTYEELKRYPTLALQRTLNSKTDGVDTQRYYRLKAQCHNHRNSTNLVLTYATYRSISLSRNKTWYIKTIQWMKSRNCDVIGNKERRLFSKF